MTATATSCSGTLRPELRSASRSSSRRTADSVLLGSGVIGGAVAQAFIANPAIVAAMCCAMGHRHARRARPAHRPATERELCCAIVAPCPRKPSPPPPRFRAMTGSTRCAASPSSGWRCSTSASTSTTSASSSQNFYTRSVLDRAAHLHRHACSCSAPAPARRSRCAQGQRWPRFWRRWAQVAGCALLVTLGSWLMFPRSLISFGVLHGIARDADRRALSRRRWGALAAGRSALLAIAAAAARAASVLRHAG